LALAEKVISAHTIVFHDLEVETLVAVDLEGEGVVPSWVLSTISVRLGLLGLAADLDDNVWISSTELLTVVGESTKLRSNYKLSLH